MSPNALNRVEQAYGPKPFGIKPKYIHSQHQRPEHTLKCNVVRVDCIFRGKNVGEKMTWFVQRRQR